jgi:TolB protein
MNLQTGALRQLTQGSRQNVQPNWSPDGRKFAFTSYRNSVGSTDHQEIYVMDNDGANPKRLTQTPASTQNFLPHWSPRGNEIVFARIPDATTTAPRVFVMNADGSNTRDITRNLPTGIPYGWSPDGSRILIRGPANTSNPSDNSYQIYQIDADGGNAKRTTDTPYLNTQPQYSPDGSRIVYTSIATGHIQVFVMNGDGSNQRNITNSPSNDNQPVWWCRGK